MSVHPPLRPPRALLGLSFALLVVLIYADPLFVHRNFAGRDLVAYNVPTEKAVHDSYAAGHFPVWMPYVSGGRPLLPNPNAGALYPLRILLSPVPFALEMRLYPLIHWVAAGIGLLLLVRAIGGSLAAAWIGAVTYVFSGVVVSEVFFPHIEPGMALLPWIVWSVRRLDPQRVGPLLLLSILLGIDMLAGDVFTVGLGILCALLWILLEEPRAERLQRGLLLGVAVGLASLIAAPQIIATLLWIPETNRAVIGMKLGEVLQYSIPPWRLLEFVIPYPFGPTWDLNDKGLWSWGVLKLKYVGLFVTLYAGGLATIAAMARWRERRPGIRFARSLLVLTLTFSILPSLVTGRLTAISSPLPLRNPEKLAVAVALSLALMSGLFVDRLRQGHKIARWTLVVGGVLALAALAARCFPAAAGSFAVTVTGAGKTSAESAGMDLQKSLSEAGLLWMGSVIALELLARGQGRRARTVGLLLLTFVPIASNRRIARSFREEEIFSAPAFVRFINRRDPGGRYRTLGESMYRASGRIELEQTARDLGFLDYVRNNWYQHSQILWRRGTVFNGDFDAGDLARIEALRRISGTAAKFKDSAGFFASFSLRWGIRYRDQGPVTGYRPIGGDSIRVWDELPGALPDIRLVERWKEEAGSLPALQALPGLAAGEIVIERDKAAKGTARPGNLRILENRPERLRVETQTLDPTWLFVLRGFWNWRTVTLDGHEVDVYPAQLAFSAIAIPAGLHRVDWRETFPGLKISAFGPLLFLVIAGSLIAWKRATGAGRTS